MSKANKRRRKSSDVARPYQVELLEKAKSQNAIVFLGTGAGKTYIASMMIKEVGAKLISKDNPKVAIFIVNTVALVDQQRDYLQRTTSLKCASFCGADGVDAWDLNKWAKELKGQQVLVFVAQVFLDLLNKGLFCFDKIALLVIDEIHHAQKNHPYNQIMRRYKEFKEVSCDSDEDLPKILGLSASIVVEKCDSAKFVQLKNTLESNTDCKVITTENLASILKYVTSPDESYLYYSLENAELNRISTIIEESCSEINTRMEEEKLERAEVMEGISLKQQKEKDQRRCKDVIRILRQLSDALQSLGIYAAEKLVQFYEESLMETKIQNAEEQYLLDIYELAKACATSVRAEVNRVYARNDIRDEYQKLCFYSTEKVRKLLDLLETEGRFARPDTPSDDEEDKENRRLDGLEKQMLEHSNMTGIVFVQMRQTAAVLSHIIDMAAKYNPNLAFLRSGFTTGSMTSSVFKGQFSPEIIEASNQERQKLMDVLKNFREGEINCIVSTSVLEEGVDVRQCNLVVRFDKILEFRSYVQSKGRARAKPSKFIIMMDEANNYTVEIKTYRKIEVNAIDLCHNQCEDDDEPMEEDEIEIYRSDPQDPNSPRVDSLSAISRVCQYVQSLPSDKFTTLAPFFEYEENATNQLRQGLGLQGTGGQIKCILKLPHLTPIRDPVEGPLKSSKILAKRAVALKAVELLHFVGELDYRLTPKKKIIEFDDNEEDASDEHDEAGRKTGTKKRRRYYKNVTHPRLKCSLSNKSYLYKINLVMVKAITEEENVKRNRVYLPEQFSRKLGFLCDSVLPVEAHRSFNLFMPSGKVAVSLECLGQVDIEPELLEMAEKFHQMIFNDVLKMTVPWMSYTKNDELLVVPINSSSVDSQFLFGLNRSQISFDDSVVIPLHRKMERCFVQEVLLNLAPTSVMPGSKKTFAEHYQTNFGIGLRDNDQHLLRVSSADKKYDDLFNPVVKPKQSSSKQNSTNFLDDRWILIPELVKIHPVPASLWQECQLLPFVLHQLNRILKVGEFRSKANESQQIRSDLYDEMLLPLEYDFNVKLSFKEKSFRKLIEYPTHLKCSPSPLVDELLRCFTATGAGLTFDLEKEEVLGDSFLKFASSIFLYFTELKELNEGHLTLKRSLIVGNKNLYKIAVANKFENVFQSNKFVPRLNWRPPRMVQPEWLESALCKKDSELKIGNAKDNLFSWLSVKQVENIHGEEDIDIFVEETLAKRKSRQSVEEKLFNEVEPRDHSILADKSLADVVESLIGCFLVKNGQAAALRFMSCIGINLISKEKDGHENWFVAPSSALHPDLDQAMALRKLKVLLNKHVDVEKIEGTLGYKFKDKSFLVQALTHCSFVVNKITHSMERLEFFGDAILDYLVTCFLVTELTELNPGELTNLRSALVNNNTFAKIVVDNHLHPHLLQGSPTVWAKISDFVADSTGVQTSQKFVKNLELRNEEQCPILDDIEVPKVLGDILEALMGAIFIDSGFDLVLVWRSFRKLFPSMDEVIKLKPKNNIQLLYEEFPERVTFKKKEESKLKNRSFMYVKIMSKDGKEVKVFGGVGNNLKRAKHAAATCALRELKGKQF